MQLFVDRLTNVDFSYLHPQRGLVGESWLVNVTLEGALDEQGMICDFGVIKKTLKQWLDNTIDHSLVVPAQSPLVTIRQDDAGIDLNWQYNDRFKLTCCSPAQAVTLIDGDHISPESVADWCIGQCGGLLPDTVHCIHLSFEPENIAGHYYHYSHGLKKHAGSCQRIAHGHRSTLEIYRDGQRDSALEAQWCEQWRDIYIGTREDLQATVTIAGEPCHVFHYESLQGRFELTLPVVNCYLLDTETTVECIARHIADTLKQRQPGCRFVVRAFEGIGKGAVALK